MRFNHSVQVDMVLLDGRIVINLVDFDTHFGAAAFLKFKSNEKICWTSELLWTLHYMGPTDLLEVEQGKAYVSNQINRKVIESGFKLSEALIESQNSIGTVDFYHEPLLTA